MSYVRLERLTGSPREYTLDIPVMPAPARPLILGANIARNETSGHYSSEIIQSKTFQSITFDFTLCKADFYLGIGYPIGLKEWWDDYVIDSKQIWAYVTYDPFMWSRLPMTIIQDQLDCSYREGQVYFDFSLSLVERFLAPAEGDAG